jgi:hypothetical protein
LSDFEIEQLKEHGWNHHEKDYGGEVDLYKDKSGNVYEKGKGNVGPGEPIGYNINTGWTLTTVNPTPVVKAAATTATIVVVGYVTLKIVEGAAAILSGGTLAWTLAF